VKERNALPKAARNQLAREQHAGAGMHPDADMLNAFCEGVLDLAERSQVLDHVARCSECREVVFLAAPDAAAGLIAAPPNIEHAQPFTRFWRRYRPAMAAAAALVVVGSAVLLNREYRTESPVAQVTETPKIETAQAQPIPPRVPEVQTSVPKGAVAGDAGARTTDAGKVSALKQLDAVAGGAMADQDNEQRRFDLPASSVSSQQQLLAPGPRGALMAKGNATNYQTLAATPPSSTPSMPSASRYGGASAGAIVGMTAEANTAKAERPAPPAKAESFDDNASKARKAMAEAVDSSARLSQLQEKASRDAGIRTRAHWRINDAGQLQRQFGSGDWETLLADTSVSFKVVSVMGDQVWAGGAAGALYQSTDAGDHWSKSSIPGLTDTITQVQFRDASTGTVTTSSGAVWETHDGGAHWRRK
jgi:Photosynthesis system II assembly factor YCF48/Putative zinc-finger